MTNPALEFRLKAQQTWPGAIVHSRGRNWIRHQHPTNPNRFMLDATIGSIHYGASFDQEIDTAWQVGDAIYQWRMNRASYIAEAKTLFNGAPLVRYTDQTSGEWITFQARQLEYNNDRNDVQLINSPQGVSANIVGDIMSWANAFGNGLDFEWQTETNRLSKRLIIQSFSNLPIPTAQILGGTNPVLRLQWQFAYSSNISVWINGTQWDEHSDIDSTQIIEFRNIAGQVLWVFKPAIVFAADRFTWINAVTRISRSGPNLFVEVRVPYTWLQTATYPITIDPTIDTSVPSALDDCEWRTNGIYDNNGTWVQLGSNGTLLVQSWRGGFRFTGLTFSGTVDVSYLTVKAYDNYVGGTVETVYAEDADNPGQITDATDGEARVRTTNSAAWTLPDFTAENLYNTPSLNSVLQELVDSYTISNDAVQLILEHDLTEHYQYVYTYDSSSAKAASLHIEYTTGGGVTKSPTDTGTGTDQKPTISASLAVAEVGTGVDSVSITVSGEIISGSTCWGHVTGVLEANIRTFASHWTGTGSIDGSGDSERLILGVGQYMISEVVNTGVQPTTLLQNNYAAGDAVTLSYRHGATQAACEAASWNVYTAPFDSLGYVQVKVEA